MHIESFMLRGRMNKMLYISFLYFERRTDVNNIRERREEVVNTFL